MLLLRAWLSMVTRLTEPIDPKNLRMRPAPASADVISGHHYQNPSRRDLQRPTFKSEVGWRKAKREESAMTETQRVAIVTGAAGGIGRAMVRGLLAAGVRVAGVDRDHEPLEALAASAGEQGKGDDFLTVQTDLTSDSAVDEITRATRARFGRIDILVNNAEIGPGFDHGAARAQLS